MDCARSIELLSGFLEEALDSEEYVQVQIHLVECPPCAGVFSELNIIIIAATKLRDGADISFPDESVVWQRMEWANRATS